ncbi:MAG: hypothetical protein OXC70_00025 [Gammaproteobacteria bacterium]|nr:hypothetical protein [Gammaproteobacteria bacterium]
MPQRFGIDTSILVRLLTRDPEDEFEYCITSLSALAGDQDGEILASNQVIGEAYVAVQHHYGVARSDARAGLLDVLQSGLVAPLNGRSAIDALSAAKGPGLFDRLIADDYSRAGLETLTLDRRMASLSAVQRL